jgi:phage terminase large subunit
MDKVKIKFLSEYKDLFNEDLRYIVYYGGRYSGKSYHTALALLLRGRQKKLRILCTREIQNTIKDSVHKLLKDLMFKYSMFDYTVTKEEIRNSNGTEFIFKGLKRNTTEIKSMEGIDICWIEEAQSITEDSLNILVPTIRKEGSQIIVTFNRFEELDPVYVRFVMNKTDKTLAKLVNYDVMNGTGLITETIKEEIETAKKDPTLFAHIWLGEPLGQSDSAVMSRSDILDAMNREVDDDGAVIVGVDVARMGSDRTVLWKRKGFKTTDYKVYTHKRTTEVSDLIEDFVNNNTETEIRVDDTGVGGGVTDILIRRGYNIIPINFGGEPADKNRYTNVISEAWFYLKNIIKEIELPEDRDLLMELSTREWKQDPRGRRKIESKDDYKKKGYKSPDLADACIICYYQPQIATPDIHFI